MFRKVLAATVALLGLCAAPAFAQPFAPNWYFGAGIGRGNLNMSGTDLANLDNATIGDSGTTYTARLGYRFLPWLATEVGYYDLGEYDFSGDQGLLHVSGTAKAKSVGISLVGIVPMGPNAELYGRVGWAQSEVKANASTLGFVANSSDKQSEATYGVGAKWYLNRNWGIFAEWMKNDSIEVDSYMAGVEVRF